MKAPHLLDDFRASVVVFLVALPLCLGIALASNAPLSSGLIAGIIGGLVVGFISQSSLSVSGPAAGLTVLVAVGIADLGGFAAFGLAIVLAGVMQVIFYFFRGGALGDYFPTAVIKGMLAAIGLLLIIKQGPNALGLQNGVWNKGILLLSAFSLLTILGWEKWVKNFSSLSLIPGALIAVVGSLVLNEIFSLVDSRDLVSLPGDVLALPAMPDFSLISFSIVGVALTMATVASLETLLCVDAADKLDPLKRKSDKNRELLAQGIGNTLSGLLGGLPLTAVIVRTSANVNAGAKSKLSSILHGGWLLLCVLLIPNLLNRIPLATLACVLLLVGYKLIRPELFVEMWKKGPDQVVIFVTTILAIVGTDLLKGIFVGLAMALLFDIRRLNRKTFEVTSDDKGLHVRFHRDLSFLHKVSLAEVLNAVPIGGSVTFYNLAQVRVHTDVGDVLAEFKAESVRHQREIFYK